MLWAFFVTEFSRTDGDVVTVTQEMLGDSLGINENAILAAPVDNPGCITIANDHGMSPADTGRLELYVILISSTYCEPVLEQRKSQFLSVD